MSQSIPCKGIPDKGGPLALLEQARTEPTVLLEPSRLQQTLDRDPLWVFETSSLKEKGFTKTFLSNKQDSAPEAGRPRRKETEKGSPNNSPPHFQSSVSQSSPDSLGPHRDLKSVPKVGNVFRLLAGVVKNTFPSLKLAPLARSLEPWPQARSTGHIVAPRALDAI